MARKKKETDEQKDYDVLIGFVKSFNFVAPEEGTRLGGHPQPGRIYRLLKDPFGWRLHLGRDTNKEGLDGLHLGEHEIYNTESGQLVGSHPRYDFNIEIVTPANYLSLYLVDEDREKLFSWIETDNSDLWNNLKKEQTGEASVIRTSADLMNLIMKNGVVPAESAQSASELEKERALEATLTFLTYYKSKPVDQILALFDGMYTRIFNTLKS